MKQQRTSIVLLALVLLLQQVHVSLTSGTAAAAVVSSYNSGNSPVAWQYDVTSAPSRNASIPLWAAQQSACAVELAKHFLKVREPTCVVKKVLHVRHVAHCYANGYPHAVLRDPNSEERMGSFSPMCDVFVTRTRETTPLLLGNVTEVTAVVRCCEGPLSSCPRRIAYVALHLESAHAAGLRAHSEQARLLRALCYGGSASSSSSSSSAEDWRLLADVATPIAVTISRPSQEGVLSTAPREQREEKDSSSPSPAKSETSSDPAHRRIPFRLLNYNIWNYNGDWPQRLLRINRFMRDLATSGDRFMAGFSSSSSHPSPFGSRSPSSLPHLILFQEVRYHNYFVASSPSSQAAMGGGSKTKDQAFHLWRNWSSRYNFFYHPSMTYFRIERGVQIEVEGPMIFQLADASMGRSATQASSTAATTVVELVARVPLRLTRLGRDGDDHQRLLLCGVFLVKQSAGSDVRDERLTLRVDVCTTHFSLAGDAQLLNAMEVANFTRDLARRRQFDPPAALRCDADDGASSWSWEWSTLPQADITIVAGDLNALPSAACLNFLQAPGKGGGFRDAYHMVDPDGASERQRPCRIYDPQRTTDFAMCNGHGSDGESEGLTFDSNADSLKKRIDFILYKAWGWEAEAADVDNAPPPPPPPEPRPYWDVEVKSLCRLGCKHKLEPIASSDHLALLADIEFVRRPG